MNNFTMYNPTKLFFGKGVTEKLGKTVLEIGKKVLLVYGKSSIHKNGIYEKITNELKKNNIEIIEFSGIKSNPIIEDTDRAAEIGRQNNVDCIVAVGGGSVIDSSKIISIAIPTQNKAWDFFEGKAVPQKAIPLIAILTLAATGTEMNPFAVQQNETTKRKIGYGHPLCYPKYSFLDPEFTFSVPRNYTAYGIADLIAHCLEAYFGAGDCSLSDRMIFSILNDSIEWSDKLLKNLNDYEARAAILYDSTMALNGQIAYGKINTDWGVHDLGHHLSLLFDTPHGASLSIMYIAWMKHFKTQLNTRLIKLGKNLFGTHDADGCIEGFEMFFKSIDCPTRLSEVGIKSDDFAKIVDVLTKNKASGNNIKMNTDDYLPLLKIAE